MWVRHATHAWAAASVQRAPRPDVVSAVLDEDSEVRPSGQRALCLACLAGHVAERRPRGLRAQLAHTRGQLVEVALDDVVEANEADLAGVDNMLTLHAMSEASILHTLRVRVQRNQVYVRLRGDVVAATPCRRHPNLTRARGALWLGVLLRWRWPRFFSFYFFFFGGGAGDARAQTWIGPILVFVNPYNTQNQLDDRVQLAQALTASNSPGVSPSPHVYATAAAVYADMVETTTNQTVVITGESGAGAARAAADAPARARTLTQWRWRRPPMRSAARTRTQAKQRWPAKSSGS